MPLELLASPAGNVTAHLRMSSDAGRRRGSCDGEIRRPHTVRRAHSQPAQSSRRRAATHTSSWRGRAAGGTHDHLRSIDVELAVRGGWWCRRKAGSGRGGGEEPQIRRTRAATAATAGRRHFELGFRPLRGRVSLLVARSRLSHKIARSNFFRVLKNALSGVRAGPWVQRCAAFSAT